MNHGRTRRLTHLVVGAVLGVVAFTLVLMATDPPGPGLDPDAMAYMGAAESVASHARYRVPAADWWNRDSTAALTHFPPGYPTALALPVRLGMTPPQAARLIDAGAAFVTVTVVVLLVAGSAGVPAGALAGLALLVMPAMEVTHISVLSEPLFLACLALALVAMTRRPTDPIAVGVVAACATLVRYAGVALAGAAALWAAAQPGTRRERARRAALALLPTALAQGAWVLRTKLIALHEPAQIRRVAVYGGVTRTLVQGGATLRDWLVPDPQAWSDPMPWRPALALVAGLVVATLLVAGARRARTRLLPACALLAACYLGLLVVSRLFADPRIPFDERLLAPLFLLATIAIATSTAAWWRATPRLLPRAAVALGLAGWLAMSAWTTAGQMRYVSQWGSDFAGEQWRRSEVLAWARTDGAPHPLYTNWPSAVYFHLHRASRYVPLADDTLRLAAFADTLRAHDGRALLFTVRDWDYATAEVLARVPELEVIEELTDGIVLQARERPAP